MLKKLQQLIRYCKTIASDKPDVPKPHIVADKEQGTSALNSPSIKGASFAGDCDNPTGSFTVVIFALEKGLEQSGTESKYVDQYLATIELLGQLLEKFLSDMGGSTTTSSCPILNGMEISECIVAPEAGIFGGWNGYSARQMLMLSVDHTLQFLFLLTKSKNCPIKSDSIYFNFFPSRINKKSGRLICRTFNLIEIE